ncbi:MAG TPA: hypothetical protein VGV60_01990 [Candidatus Polarisedimenticolia bacterium]|jgi:hypothetical protein|nr:hypothetical protein [Candidatus Polarisedimenticolia bacterium]
MTRRTILSALVLASLLCFPAGASQPAGLAGKLIANPPITPAPDPNGLPGVTCTGFSWGEVFTARPLDPADTVTLELAIIPFRSGFTDVLVNNLMRLHFADGLVNGLPYRRSGWNDVRVVIRPATQDYMLTLNGAQAGPFRNELPCSSAGGCLTLEALAIRGGVFEESTAWIDSLSLVHDSAAGQARVFEKAFDQCYSSQNVFLGGMLIVEPPQKLGSR